MLTENQKKGIVNSSKQTNKKKRGGKYDFNRLIIEIIKMYTIPHISEYEITIDETLQREIKELLFTKGFFSIYYYPYDLYTYMLAFEKYIDNKQITDSLASISVDCAFTNSITRLDDGTVPVVCNYSVGDPQITKHQMIDVDTSTVRYDHLRAKLDVISGILKKKLLSVDYIYIPDFIQLLKDDALPSYITPDEVTELVSESIRIITKKRKSNEYDIHSNIIEKTITCPGDKSIITVQGYAELIGGMLFFRPYESGHHHKQKYIRRTLMEPHSLNQFNMNTVCSYSNYIKHKSAVKQEGSFGTWIEENMD
jgi:hypothetical protein